MSPSAQRAQLDFVRLVAEEPSSLYFEQFLREGFNAWPDSYQQRFPGLDTWPGVSGLKQRLRDIVRAPSEWEVRLASRSLSLVHQATQQLFDVCTNVLTTDLSWPSYQDAVARAATATGNHITNVTLRNEILYQAWTVDDVCNLLAEAYVANRCDGLFLPAVDHLGVRLPIHEIVDEIRRRSDLNFVLIDAAQAFCHVPLDESIGVADFVVAGGHKWMQAYLPIGIGFERRIQNSSSQLQRWGTIPCDNDPLWRLSQHIDRDQFDSYSETANVANLTACAGAVSDLEPRLFRPKEFVPAEVHQINPSFPGNWRAVSPQTSMRTRIALFQSEDVRIRRLSERALRKHWMNHGYVISAYPEGIIRLSIPPLRNPGS